MKKLTFLTLGLLMAFTTISNAQEQKKEDEGYKFTEIKRLPTTSVKSQDRAGTCWSWSTISFLESEMMRLGKDSVSLSPLYVVWNTYHGKGDKYVRMNGHVNFGQGGACADVTWAIKNYGIVPLELYSGRCSAGRLPGCKTRKIHLERKRIHAEDFYNRRLRIKHG